MTFVVVTGMSGAGKSRAVAALEDQGFFCVDNFPIELLSKFGEMVLRSQDKMKQVAIVIDSRSVTDFVPVMQQLAEMRQQGLDYRILFLDAADNTIIRRYKETRRKHPLSDGKTSIYDTIVHERTLLAPIRERADFLIDTTSLSPAQLKEQIDRLFLEGKRGLTINVVSFGFKYGILIDADLVFDVRFIPNPFYKQELRPFSGLDEQVRRYVMEWECANVFLEKTVSLISYLIPFYCDEGKSSLTIGVGCTGGRHRSVVMAEVLKERLMDTGMSVYCYHRDIQKSE